MRIEVPHYASIDTNILLSLYDYTDDDLQKLEELADAVEAGKVVSYLAKQTVDEFKRNRAGKLADIISALEKNRRVTNLFLGFVMASRNAMPSCKPWKWRCPSEPN